MNDVKEIVEQIMSIPDEFLENTSWESIEDMFVVPLESYEIRNLLEAQLQELKEQAISPDELTDEINKIIKSIDEAAKLFEYNDQLSEKKDKLLNAVVDKIKSLVYSIENKYKFYDCIIQVQRESPDIPLPTYAHLWDGGADVASAETVVFAPGETKIVSTGLKVNVPRGWVLSIRPRSGLSAKTGLRMANCVGTVDVGYLDTVGVIFTNISTEPYIIKRGDRIAQFLVERKYNIQYEEVEDITKVASDNRAAANGQSGFGSTGK